MSLRTEQKILKEGRLNGLDVFSGIGGISEALEPWVRTRAYCEIERFPQSVLLSRMARGEIDTAPIWDDIETLRGEDLPGIDIISGGWPCQDISVAGDNEGMGEGTRSGLFREIVRLARELRPSLLFLENVSVVTIRGGLEVIGSLADIGFDARWICLSASQIGASHGRDRWWLLAHSRYGSRRIIGEAAEGRDREAERSTDNNEIGRSSKNVADSESDRLQGSGAGGREGAHIPAREVLSGRDRDRMGEAVRPPGPDQRAEWIDFLERFPTLEPSVCGKPPWLQFRSHRIRALGNSVDVGCAREAFKILMELK